MLKLDETKSKPGPIKTGLTLVTGSAWSGKTNFAVRCLDGTSPVSWIATISQQDETLKQIYQNQRSIRPNSWKEFDGSLQLLDIIKAQSSEKCPLVVDSANLWFGNITSDSVSKHSAAQLREILDDFKEQLFDILKFQSKHRPTIILSSDLGAGLPAHDQYFYELRRVVGILNQQLGLESNSTFVVNAGIGTKIK